MSFVFFSFLLVPVLQFYPLCFGCGFSGVKKKIFVILFVSIGIVYAFFRYHPALDMSDI